MTPSTIFQWPLSPSGTFQPVKSLPLKSEVKPAGGWSAAQAAPVVKVAATTKSTGNSGRNRFIGLPSDRLRRASATRSEERRVAKEHGDGWPPAHCDDRRIE